ncbi:MAG TPA: hypothetical protein VJ912_00405, partial [Candidatus Nanoarchaeia archaeon]|nr:hypothetical protein [Candidatus Nanoarchaeia archaeon]
RKIIHYKLRQKIHDLNRKKTKKPELSKEVRERIKKEFKPYVKELEEITKRPLLKEWDIE